MKRIIPIFFLLVIVIFAGCKKDDIDACPDNETLILGKWNRTLLEQKNFSGAVINTLTWNSGEVVYDFKSAIELDINDIFTANTNNIYALSDTCNTILTIDVTLSYSIKLLTADSMMYSAVENGSINNYYFIR